MPHVHGELCYFLVHPKFGRFRDATVPRSFFKTSTATIAKPLWMPIRYDSNVRILIAMNTMDNASKMVHVIKEHWQNNDLLKEAFPELVPDFKHTRWSDSCAEIKRPGRFTEGTYEAIGAGGAVISRHYDHIVEDDLVYARKDDLTGAEIQPNQDDIDKAIGWHKLVYSLFSDPGKSTIDNIGTRWAVHDLKDWISRNESNKFAQFILAAVENEVPVWPERFSLEVLNDIRDSQGDYMYSTQYLNQPRDPADAVFNIQHLRFYQYENELPEYMNIATIVDLALWGDSKGKARNVILTMGIDQNQKYYILRYDRGKFNPSQVIELMESHAHQYNSHVYVEEVQYQRAIRHFAFRRMEINKTKRYMLSPLKPDNRKNAKDLRIRGIQPILQNRALYVMSAMKDLITEFLDYPSSLTCDILDCIGHGVRVLYKPSATIAPRDENPMLLDNILSELGDSRASTRYPFNIQCKKERDYAQYS